MNRITSGLAALMLLALGTPDSALAGGRLGHLEWNARQLAQLAERFEDVVDRTIRGPLARLADDFEESAEDFLDDVEDGDFRDARREFVRLSGRYQQLQFAFLQSPLSRQPHARALWFQLSQAFQQVQAQMAYGVPGGIPGVRPWPQPQPLPVPRPRPYPPYHPYGR